MHRARLRDGTEVEVRPITSSDKRALREAFERLSADSRFRRFHSPTNELSDAALRYLTDVDHHNHEALVAVDPDSHELVGVARFVRDRERLDQAEAAIAVADDRQRLGLGKLLLERLTDRAREHGVDRFTALVQSENRDALRLFQRLGARVAGREGTELNLELDIPRHAGTGAQLPAVLRAAAEGRLDVRSEASQTPVGGS